MALAGPPLDPRTFADLVEEARRLIRLRCPSWTDHSPHDPGMVLVEAFAHLTEILLYRLNRLPERAYVEFLRLIGVRLRPATAAVATLRFSLKAPRNQPTLIPQGTRVTVGAAGGGSAPVFSTVREVRIEAGETAVAVSAYDCVMDTERIGLGTGLAGQSFGALRPFVLASALPTERRAASERPELDLRVGVEAIPSELDDRAPAVMHGDRTFLIWDEVEQFTPGGGVGRPFLADRAAGLITFAPAARMAGSDGALAPTAEALGPVPAAGREIRVWGPRGGGPTGNVAAGTLTVLVDPLPGVDVTNPEPASGGAAAETLDNALLRGPAEFRSIERAVTASDFERLAQRSSAAVARARAFTKADIWSFAAPGTVEVALVPALPPTFGTRVGRDDLERAGTAAALQQVRQELDLRRPLGTGLDVHWAQYKSVAVRARVVVHRAEEERLVQARLVERLYERLSPLPNAKGGPGWPFGEPLRVSTIYNILLADPGVRHVDDATIRLVVDEVPDRDVNCLLADPFQARAFYAGSGAALYRSVNDGASWEPVLRTPGETLLGVDAHPALPGLLAAFTRFAAPRPDGTPGERSKVYVSWDCGATWRLYVEIAAVSDVAWSVDVAGVPRLFLATETGLYGGPVRTGGGADTCVQLVVDAAQPTRPLYAVATAASEGKPLVAAATAGRGGVFLSSEDGRSGTFRAIGPQDEDIRVLTLQRQGPRAWLWAGTAARGGNDPGKGALRYELRGAADPPEGWVRFATDWSGGSCFGIAFADDWVLAGSHDMGLQRLDLRSRTPAWKADRQFESGLPLREAERLFQPVRGVAARGGQAGLVLCGGPKGISRSLDAGQHFATASRAEFTDEVRLPETWLIASGDHQIEVGGDDAVP